MEHGRKRECDIIRMKALIDMNLPPALAEILTENGIEAVHWVNVGAPDAKDAEIMEYAHDNDYVVVSCDLDFSAILSVTHGTKPSIVQLRTHGLQIEKMAKIIAIALQHHRVEMDSGAIMTIDIRRARVRLLPL